MKDENDLLLNKNCSFSDVDSDKAFNSKALKWWNGNIKFSEASLLTLYTEVIQTVFSKKV